VQNSPFSTLPLAASVFDLPSVRVFLLAGSTQTANSDSSLSGRGSRTGKWCMGILRKGRVATGNGDGSPGDSISIKQIVALPATSDRSGTKADAG
jgi:hypothetical protein